MDGYGACGFVVSDSSDAMPVGIWLLFHGFFHTLCHEAYGSLRIVEPQVLCILDLGMVLEYGRSGFVRSICFLIVHLV